MKPLCRAVLLSVTAMVGGCKVGPDFTSPVPPAVQDWHRSAARDRAVQQGTDPDPRWWQSFNDPLLTELVQTAIHGNLDLQQAVLRVVEERQRVVVARAVGLPTLNGTGLYSRQQLGLRGVLESDGVYKRLNELADQNSPLNRIAPGAGTAVGSVITRELDKTTEPLNFFQYGLDASWQLDLFGRVSRSVEAAQATAEAQAEATNDALIMLESEVGQTYLQLRGAQALAASQRENVRVAQNSLDLTIRRERQGLTTGLDVDQARTQLLSIQQQLPEYERQAAQAVDSLNVLVGQPPGALDGRLLVPARLPSLPRVVGIGVPSELARRRPDIREAEAMLHAATADVGVAVASFYPDVSLTGNLGLRAIDASYLANWASHFYSLGPAVSVPIFQGGRLTGNLRLAKAEAAAAALKYRGTVLNALREVEDALVSYRTGRAERDRLAQTVRTGEDTLHLATDQYDHGLNTFLQVLDSERSLITARQQLVQADVSLANDVVALYRALGGGWEEPGARPEPLKISGEPPPTPAAADSLAAAPPPLVVPPSQQALPKANVPPVVARRNDSKPTQRNVIEIDLGAGRSVKVGSDVDPASLARILDVVEKR